MTTRTMHFCQMGMLRGSSLALYTRDRGSTLRISRGRGNIHDFSYGELHSAHHFVFGRVRVSILEVLDVTDLVLCSVCHCVGWLNMYMYPR